MHNDTITNQGWLGRRKAQLGRLAQGWMNGKGDFGFPLGWIAQDRAWLSRYSSISIILSLSVVMDM